MCVCGKKVYTIAAQVTLLLTSSAIDMLFALSLENLLQCLSDVVSEWFQLGVYLKVLPRKLEEIRCNNRDDVIRCKTVMLLEWLKDPTLKPSWCSLVDALNKLGSNRIVHDITQKFSTLFIMYTVTKKVVLFYRRLC